MLCPALDGLTEDHPCHRGAHKDEPDGCEPEWSEGRIFHRKFDRWIIGRETFYDSKSERKESHLLRVVSKDAGADPSAESG